MQKFTSLKKSAHVLSCIDTVKTHKRNESLKKKAEKDNSSVELRTRLLTSKSTVFSIEIIEESEQQAKVHYIGHSYDEWIRKSQIGYKPVSLQEHHVESLETLNLSMLACSIKKLIPGKREDLKVRIQLPFDRNSLELLKEQGVPLTKHHGHQSYGQRFK